MITRFDTAKAASILCDVRSTAEAIPALPEPVRPETLDEAYAIQVQLNEQLTRDVGLGPVAGYKIGCTTQVMQDYLGIGHPCAGAMFERSIREGEGRFDRRTFCRPGVECEIAVDIARDLPAEGEITAESVALHVGAARASIELVDDRWTDFTKVSTPELVSDNFFNAGCVFGPSVGIPPMSLDTLAGRMSINGEEVGDGTGADILGHPMAALAWLAGHMRAHGQMLRAGDTVTLGSLVKTHWIDAGDTVEIAIDGLGSCRLVMV